MHVKFEESNFFVKNVVEIDSLGDLEKVSMKYSSVQDEEEKT